MQKNYSERPFSEKLKRMTARLGLSDLAASITELARIREPSCLGSKFSPMPVAAVTPMMMKVVRLPVVRIGVEVVMMPAAAVPVRRPAVMVAARLHGVRFGRGRFKSVEETGLSRRRRCSKTDRAGSSQSKQEFSHFVFLRPHSPKTRRIVVPG